MGTSLRCLHCAVPMVVSRILTHLGLAAEAAALAPAGHDGVGLGPTGEEVPDAEASGDGFEVDRLPDDDEVPP